ncbi:MAG: NifU family protein [Chloroflexaceae bacterium]|jgi:Fe-S cluster biogenesis protein NfuA/nitrite reductase/ring-hydroxylating ferredoxin subunit|nr:NifU family protein [Chloroflexaceae bacterium]
MTQNGHTLEAPTDELDTLARRVDAALEAARKLDVPARQVALELKEALEAIHKAGLTHIVRHLKADPRGKELLFELVDAPLVYALFAMHGIVKADLATRVLRVIDAVRPYMQSHGGDVELVEVQGSTAFVRLHGACNGCSMSAVTLREGVEEALKHNVPEITAVEVVPNEPGPALIGLDSIGINDKSAGWLRGPALADVPPGSLRRIKQDDVDVLLINLDNRLSAYRNECAHQGRPLHDGLFDPESGTITCPAHGFCFDAASGECFTAPQAQLESFPLRVEDGYIWVRPS